MLAVAGVVLINQSAAPGGQCDGPGTRRALSVTISVSGSYRLSGNLIMSDPNANTDGIDI